MQDQDKQILASLMETYDYQIVLATLSDLLKDEADQLSDIGCKERAIATISVAEKLNFLAKK